jgi:ABC-type nickel/cobalt efflux system permease component RcnA
VETEGLRFGVVMATFLYGLRHGIDLDHLAAISDITGSQSKTRRALFLATVYALGHAAVVLILGTLAIFAGEALPSGVDRAMEHVVGISLLLLAGYVFYSLIRYGRDFRLRSRWALLFQAVRRTFRWLKRQAGGAPIEIEHSHAFEHAHHHHGGLLSGSRSAVGGGGVATQTVAPRHRHVVALPDDPFVEYGVPTSMAIGMIHGVGAETPTQILLLVTAAGVGGGPAGFALLAVFIAGLLVSNSAVAAATAVGFAQGKRAPAIYLTLALITGIASFVMGLLYVAGKANVLPSIF